MDLAEIEEKIMAMGCTDGGCLLRPKRPGIHTNGGCRCVPNYNPSLAEQRTVRASLTWWRRLADSVRASLAEVEQDHARYVSESQEARRALMAERDKARANFQFMVDRAANERLDGYRALGQRAADAEARAEQAEQERDEIRRQFCLLSANLGGTPRGHACLNWSIEVAERLFPEDSSPGSTEDA